MTKTAAFFEIAEPHMKEFDDYRINGLMEAAKAESMAALDLVRQLARMDPPDERDEIAEVDGEIEAFSHMIRKAKEVVAGIPTAPVEPSITGVERVIFDLLCENFVAWDGEEDSVKEEHADLIEKTEAFIDANRARFYPSAEAG